MLFFAEGVVRPGGLSPKTFAKAFVSSVGKFRLLVIAVSFPVFSCFFWRPLC